MFFKFPDNFDEVYRDPLYVWDTWFFVSRCWCFSAKMETFSCTTEHIVHLRKNQRRTLLCKIAAVVGHWSQVISLLWKSFAAILLWKQIPLFIFFKFLLKTWEEVQNRVRGEKQLTMVCRRPGKHFNEKRGFVTGGAQRKNRHRV